MKLGELWRRWQTRGYPENMITEVEAIDRARQYAEANERTFHKPIEVLLEQRPVDPGNRNAGFRHVYVITLGTSIPMPRVEVNAVSGEVLAWRCPSR